MNETEFDAINVIPFIDILLVLLTIVLVTSTFITTGALQVDLPQGQAPKLVQVNSLDFSITDDGQIFIDKRPIQLADIAAETATYDRETRVVIRADRQIALQLFIDLMARIKQQGFEKVSLLTETS